jgi:small conductance mechanosensitive channel
LPTLTPDQAQAALDTLNDPKKRAAFTATLEALVRGQPAAAPTPPPSPNAAKPPPTDEIPLQLEPNSWGAELLLAVSKFLSSTADRLTQTMHAAHSLPLLWGWLVVMVTNPIGHRLLADAGWRLAVVLALSLGVAWSLRFMLRRPTARVLALGRPRAPPKPKRTPRHAPNAARPNRPRANGRRTAWDDASCWAALCSRCGSCR